MQSSWPQLFAHPQYRKGWEDHVKRVPPTEPERDNVIYLFGRLMSAECRWPRPPRISTVLTQEMVDCIRRCPAFEAQMIAAQWLQAHGDPSKMTTPLGTKQGDAT